MEGRGGKRARSAVGERAADPRRESVVAPMAVLSPAATIGFQTARVGTMTNYGSRVRVLVAGAGVAGLETALALRALAPEFVSVQLVAPEAEFTYRPLAVAEPFRVGEVRRFPLEPLARAAGSQLRRGTLTTVASERKLVTLNDEV